MMTPAKKYRRFRHRIAPAQAKAWLDAHNNGNRSLIANRVAHYARIMATGQWRVSEASVVVFDSLGRLRQGQHRLEAIVESGNTIESWVIFGMSPGDADLYDTGAAWANSDILFRDSDSRNKRRIGAIIRHITFLVTDAFRSVKVQSVDDNRVVWAAYRPSIEMACAFRPKIKTINSAPVLASLAFADHVCERDGMAKWIEALQYGMGGSNAVSVFGYWCREDEKGRASTMMRTSPLEFSKLALDAFWLTAQNRTWLNADLPKLGKSQEGYLHFRGLQASLCESITAKLIDGRAR